MKKKSTLAISLSFFLCSFMSNQEPIVRIVIPDNYTGWGYLVGNSKSPNENGWYYMNSKGVAYIDTAIINNAFKPEFYRSEKLLTEVDVKFLFTTDEKKINRKIFLFYVLSKEELLKGDEYWRDEDNRRQVRQKQYLHKDSLILDGAIKPD